MNSFFVINMAYSTNIGICPDKALTSVCMSAASQNSLSVYFSINGSKHRNNDHKIARVRQH